MASSYDTFKELDLSRDEVERFTEALKDKKFRQLLVDYVDEVRDPENVKIYQQEVTQLEKERGVDVTFINPVPAYVIKTSINGDKKAFINVCSNEHIQKPSSVPEIRDGCRGLQWSLPHSLAPPREDVDTKGFRCKVFDVVFHADTIHLAQKNKAFRDMVNKTACDAVESNFDVALDRKNLKFPRMRYKGTSKAAVIRKLSTEKPPEMNPEEKKALDEFYANSGIPEYPPKPAEKVQPSPKKSQRNSPKKSDPESKYTTPKYIIKHRRHIELDEFTEHKTAKLSVATPKELVVEIDLPLLRSSSDIILDVADKTLQLISEKPSKYKLSLTLPYHVNQDSGNAKFDKDKKKLVVTLPINKVASSNNVSPLLDTFDSGVESDQASCSPPTSSSPPMIESVITADNLSCHHSPVAILNSKNDIQSFLRPNEDENNKLFLDPDVNYTLPEFSAVHQDNLLVITLMVKNVSESSFVTNGREDDNVSDFRFKFTSVSSGFYPLHYAFFVRLPASHLIDWEKTSTEAWDNNVVCQIAYKPADKLFESYMFGLTESDLKEKLVDLNLAALIEEDGWDSHHHVSNSSEPDEPKMTHASVSHRKKEKGKRKKNRRSSPEDHEVTTETEDDEEKLDEAVDKGIKMNNSAAIDIMRNYSESSGDEMSRSYSPSKGRGILKSFPRKFERSVSESGLDDVNWISSIENCYASMDSVIPEESELSTSYKKTVRFNEVVSRQLFRSNSSILGQRRKNLRKAKAKKRASERRHSESELLATDQIHYYKKERHSKTDIKNECDIAPEEVIIMIGEGEPLCQICDKDTKKDCDDDDDNLVIKNGALSFAVGPR